MQYPEQPLSHHLVSVPYLEADLGIDLNVLRYRPIYELTDHSMLIRDPVWGDELIGEEPHDQILVALAHTDALRRLQTIEQLTLPERYSTIPDSYYFSRWEHMWGSTIFVRRMARQMGLEPKEAMYLQLKVLLSDFKHTAFSHAGDWLFQSEGGEENDHENRSDYAATVGLTRLLELHGFDTKRVFDDSQHDITDTPQPDIDGDRADYIMREGYRWVDQSPVLREHLHKDSFSVVDGKIVARTAMGGRILAVCQALMVTEYWHDPVERLQLNLLLESLKRIFVSSNGRTTEWGSYSPRDLMTTADHTLVERLREHDEFIHLLDGVMAAVADSEKTMHWQHRRDHVRYVLEKTVGRETEKVEWISSYYDILPSSCEIAEAESNEQLQPSDRMIVVPLPAHRKRFIDPLFIDHDGTLRRTSEADPAFWQALQAMLEPTRKNYQAALIQNRKTTETLRRCFETNKAEWPKALERPRLSSSAVRSLLRKTVETSIPYASKFIDFKVTD